MDTLVRALQDSVADPRAFERIFSAQFDPLLDRLVRRVFDTEVAVDIAAETLAEAFIQRRKFRGSSDAQLVSWLIGISNRKLARFYRKAQTERRALRRLALEPPALSEEEHLAVLERSATAKHQREQIRDALRDLSEPQRVVLTLRVVDEMPYSSIARQLGISEQATRARVARALKSLRDAFAARPLED